MKILGLGKRLFLCHDSVLIYLAGNENHVKDEMFYAGSYASCYRIENIHISLKSNS